MDIDTTIDQYSHISQKIQDYTRIENHIPADEFHHSIGMKRKTDSITSGYTGFKDTWISDYTGVYVYPYIHPYIHTYMLIYT
jgi:hypothetical protein